MEQECACCPVCTLYLREGITLQAHLETHPKDKVIEALLKVTNANSTPQTSQPAEEPVHGQSCVAPSSGIVTQTSNYGSSQTQVTAAVTYQHFVTTNASTVIPQYIQVVAPNSSTSLVPNPTITFVPHPHPSPYVPSMYNPLYSPYIPQPYPLVQPIYTNMPFSSDVNPLMSTSQVTSPVIAPSTSQNAASGKSDLASREVFSIATNTTSDTQPVRKSKKVQLKSRLASRYTSRLLSRSQGRYRLKKQLLLRRRGIGYASAASTSGISAVRSQRASNANGRTNTAAKTSVIAKAKSLRFRNKPISPKPSTSSSASVITQLPMTPGATIRSRSSSESSSSPGPSPCPAANVSFVSPAAFETEETHLEPDDSNSKPDLLEQNNRNAGNVNDYLVNCERAASSCSVITERNSAIQLTGDMFISNCSMYENISDSDSQNESAFPQLPFHVEASTLVRDQQPEMSENVCENFERELFVNEQDRLSDYEEEIPEKMFHSFEIKQEKKVGFNFELGNEEGNEEENNVNRGGMFGVSGAYTPEGGLPSGAGSDEQENDSEIAENETLGDAEDDGSGRGVKKVSSVIFLGNGSGSNPITPATERGLQGAEERNFSDVKPLTYTDLQPAANNSVLEDLEMAASLNLNNYMEVDGVKIFFNTGNVQNMPLEPIIKFSNLKTDVPNVQNFMKPENERETLVESVIHLVSGTTPKGDFSGETFHSSASENNGEVRDLSPLSLNIRADESMPARGELSEQESLGAENSTWALFHSEIRTKSEQELMSGNEFRATILDVEDCEGADKSVKSSFWRENLPGLKHENLHESTALEKGKTPIPRKPKIFSCSECKENFSSLRARKNHVIQNHFYDLNKDPKVKTENEGRNENGVNSKENLTESASESATESATESAIAEKFEDDEAVKVESSTNKPSEKSSSCEVTRLCPGCNLPFMGLKKLKEHLKEVHGESKHKCGTCSEIFETEKEYNAHLRIHPLECNQCGKLFNRKPNLKLHMKRHLSVKPYSCNQCPKSFVTRQKLDEHLNGHTGHKPLKCTSCDRTFSRHSNLIQHRNLHHFCGKKKVKDFVCRCGEVFHSVRKLAWHKEVHDTKPKTCSFCSQKFIHTNSVTRHIRRSHMPHYLPSDKKDTQNVQCPICGKIYLRSSLAVHMRVHNGEKPFVCKICSKSFTTKWNLELHNWTHQSRSSMPFKCSTCKSAFYREVDYIAHMNSHKNFRPFTCNICGQKFIRKYNCLRHQEEHKKEKKFVCSVPGCEKSFHRSYYLRDHMRIHTGVRPHTCHICGKASSTKSNHNKHIRIHDTREPLNTEN